MVLPWLLLHRGHPDGAWLMLDAYATQAEARAGGVERARELRGGQLAIAQIRAAYTPVVAVTLTDVTL